MEEVGIELWLLIERLATKRPRTLVQEVCFRTNEAPPNSSQAASNSAAVAKSSFKATSVYANLVRRYSEGIEHQRLALDAQTGTNALLAEFQNGLTLAQSDSEFKILSFVRQSTEEALKRAMPKLNLLRFPQLWDAFAKSLVGSSLSSSGLVEQIERFIVTPHVASERWWMEDLDGLSVVYRLTKVAMLRDPPTLELQYEANSVSALKATKVIKGRRIIHLEEELQSSTSTAALALIGRRLAQSHGFLFHAAGGLDNSMLRKTVADSEILKLLTKLHQLVKFGRVASPTSANHAPLPSVSAGSKPPFPPSSAAASSPAAVNKADLGLLFRDPEAALKNVDLNSADDYTIKEFKAKMSEGFASKVIKPGDPGYVYDKRVDIKPAGGSEWDDDD